MEQLFRSGETTESYERIPYRPAGVISELSVNLPYLIEEGLVAEELAQHIEAHVVAEWGDYPEECVELIANDPIAQLDLYRLDSAVLQTGKETDEVPQARSGEFINYLADTVAEPNIWNPGLPPEEAEIIRRVPALTYEDLIFQDYRDPRTFTHGKCGISEKDFYLGHYQIDEHKFRPFIEQMFVASDFALGREFDMANQTMLSAVEEFGPDILWMMRQMRDDMNTGHFKFFREYFGKHPYKRVPRSEDPPLIEGPSGLFSASMPILDFLILGNNLGNVHRKTIKGDYYLYPRQYRQTLRRAYEIGEVHKMSLFEIFEGDDGAVDMGEGLGKVVELMFHFRNAHTGAVARQIPDVLSGKEAGTAGTEGAELREILLGRRDAMEARANDIAIRRGLDFE